MLQYTFKSQFYVIDQGTEELIKTISISAPRGREMGCMSILERERADAIRSIMEMQKGSAPSTGDATQVKDISEVADRSKLAKETIQLLKLGGANLSKCFDAVKEAAVSAESRLNGNIKTTRQMFDLIPYDDMIEIIGAYYATFLSMSI